MGPLGLVDRSCRPPDEVTGAKRPARGRLRGAEGGQGPLASRGAWRRCESMVCEAPWGPLWHRMARRRRHYRRRTRVWSSLLRATMYFPSRRRRAASAGQRGCLDSRHAAAALKGLICTPAGPTPTRGRFAGGGADGGLRRGQDHQLHFGSAEGSAGGAARPSVRRCGHKEEDEGLAASVLGGRPSGIGAGAGALVLGRAAPPRRGRSRLCDWLVIKQSHLVKRGNGNQDGFLAVARSKSSAHTRAVREVAKRLWWGIFGTPRCDVFER